MAMDPRFARLSAAFLAVTAVLPGLAAEDVEVLPTCTGEHPVPQDDPVVTVNDQCTPYAFVGETSPTDTTCQSVSCAHVRIDDALGANRLDTAAGPAPPTGSLYWGSHGLWSSGNDGAGSGLDADRLDGADGADFLRAAGGMRMVAGSVAADGSVLAGSGFTVSHFRTGGYTVTFATAFTGTPVVLGTLENTGTNGQVVAEAVTAASIQLGTSNAGGSSIDSAFHFVAMG